MWSPTGLSFLLFTLALSNMITQISNLSFFPSIKPLTNIIGDFLRVAAHKTGSGINIVALFCLDAALHLYARLVRRLTAPLCKAFIRCLDFLSQKSADVKSSEYVVRLRNNTF